MQLEQDRATELKAAVQQLEDEIEVELDKQLRVQGMTQRERRERASRDAEIAARVIASGLMVVARMQAALQNSSRAGSNRSRGGLFRSGADRRERAVGGEGGRASRNQRDRSSASAARGAGGGAAAAAAGTPSSLAAKASKGPPPADTGGDAGASGAEQPPPPANNAFGSDAADWVHPSEARRTRRGRGSDAGASAEQRGYQEGAEDSTAWGDAAYDVDPVSRPQRRGPGRPKGQRNSRSVQMRAQMGSERFEEYLMQVRWEVL